MTHQIIVCDDEPHIVRLISLKLTRAGFNVKGATNIESCWRLLHREETLSLLIVDNSMPTRRGGQELVRRIRGEARFENLPIIMLTSQSVDFEELHEIESDLKIDLVIEKPFSPRELLANVCRLTTHDLATPLAVASKYCCVDV